MKKKIDVFVLSIMIIFTLVNLMIVSIEPLIENSILLKVLDLFTNFGNIIVIIKFTKDPNYKFGYLLSAVFATIISNFFIFHFIDNYSGISNLYWIILIQGFINAVLYSYFYQLFKVSSYKRMKEEQLFKHEK